MSNPREFQDCRDCNKLGWLGKHTNKAGCILAVQAAEAANNPQWTPQWTAVERFTVWLDNGCAAGNGESPEQQALFESDLRQLLEAATSLNQLATDVIQMAQVGGMPDSYWLHDSRISRACAVLGITPEQAREMELDDE